MMTNSSPRWKRPLLTALCALCVLPAAGCKLSDPGLSAYIPSDEYFAVLSLEHHAINLSMVAPYDTVTLHTTRAMGDGSVVPGDVTYSVSSSSLSVTNGVLKAESPVARAVVRVTLTHGTITRTDSAFVSVSASAPDHLRDFGLRIPAGDSAKRDAGMLNTTISLVRESESGATLSNLLTHLVSSDTTVVTIAQSGDNAQLMLRRPGRVVLSTSTFAFGTSWRDSLVYTVGWSLRFIVPTIDRYTAGSLTPILDFAHGDITIGVGGCVIWETTSEAVDLDIQFDDVSNVKAPAGHNCAQLILDPSVGGNIAPYRKIPWDGNPENFWTAILSVTRARKFPVPGVYPFRSTLHGTKGVVRVCDERNDTTCAPVRMGGWY